MTAPLRLTALLGNREHASVSGTIVNVTGVPVPSRAPGVLWCLRRAPGIRGTFEVRPWFRDDVTREYHESAQRIVAASAAGARALVPSGFGPAPDDGDDGEWFARRLGAGVRGERAA